MKSFNLISFLFTVLLLTFVSAEQCCNVCPEGQDKYYSIDRLFNRCGECCMKSGDYWKYKIFEPGLTKANVENPCFEKGYTKYEKTETHGVFSLKMTLDKYKK